MISKTEYELLKKMETGDNIDSKKYFNEIYSLRKEGYAILQGNKYTLVGSWQRAVEEYEHFLEVDIRDAETLSIAKEANKLSNIANKKSNTANILSLIAIIVPSLISIAALIVSILAYLKN